MNPKILLVIENGQITETIANGTVEIYVHNRDELTGPVRLHPEEIENQQFEGLLQNAVAVAAATA